MPTAKGALTQALLDFEPQFGSSPAVPNGRLMPVYSNSLKATQTFSDDDLLRANRSAVAPIPGNLDASGTLVVPIDKRSIGWWLTLMFGNPVTAGVGPYTHTWKVGTSQPSAVIEKAFTSIGQYFLYNGCKASKTSFSFGDEGAQKMSIDIMAAKETLGAATYDETPVSQILEYFTAPQLAMTEGGVAIANAKAVSLDIDFGLDGDYFPIGCGGVRKEIAEGIVKPSGKLTAFFQDVALLNKAIDGTETSLAWKWTSGAHSLEIALEEVLFKRSSPEIQGKGGVSLDLDFSAYYQDGADASAIKVTLINDVASYAM